VDFVSDYNAWKNRRRGVKEAELLLREGRRVLRKYGARLKPEAAAQVKTAIDHLSKTVIDRDWAHLAEALDVLDKQLDLHLSFARKSTAREYIESIGIAVLIALFLRAFVVEAFKIPSGSMIPTLQVGDHIFVNKFIYGVRIPFTNIKFGMGYRKPKRGEVIVFIYPKEPEKDFIKRIVGIEGDTVEVRDSEVLVNGKPIPREQVPGDCTYTDFIEDDLRWVQKACDAYRETLADGTKYVTYLGHDREPGMRFPPVTVGKDNVFVMGDNRDNSHDSRFWGTVPFDLIKGKAMVVWFSKGEPEGIRVKRFFHLVE
jgi:signal peptidase I